MGFDFVAFSIGRKNTTYFPSSSRFAENHSHVVSKLFVLWFYYVPLRIQTQVLFEDEGPAFLGGLTAVGSQLLNTSLDCEELQGKILVDN